MEAPTNLYGDSTFHSADEALFGWDPTPGIVSVWASRSGKAWVWQRMGDSVRCTRETFRPWLFATTLDDLAHLGSALQLQQDEAMVSYRELDGPDGSYRYLLSARDGRMLERELLDGASQRLNRKIASFSAIDDTYYRVGPVEQYLMLTGRVFFRGWPITTCIACSSISKRPRSTQHGAASSSSPFVITAALNWC